MTDFEDIYATNAKEIHQQRHKLDESQNIEIPRDAFRRPWSSEQDFMEEAPSRQEFLEKRVKDSVILLPWYATARGVWTYLKMRRVMAWCLFVASFLALNGLGGMIPTRYYSTVHIYAPAKIDSISSRLTQVMERVEFASLPVDLKMPMMLLARELENPQARQWVIEHMQGDFPPEFVSVDAGYALASEMLVIHGFGNSPEMALQTTQLYKKYFENRVDALRIEQLDKIDKWADLRLEKISQSLDELKPQVASLSSYSSDQQKVANIRQKLSDKMADLILRKINLQRLQNQINQAKWSQDLNSMQTVDNSELQELMDVYHGLTKKQNESKADDKMQGLYKQEKTRIEVQIRDQMSELGQSTQKEMSQLENEISKLQTEISKYGSQESDIKFASGKESDFAQRMTGLENQKDELLKLKNQVQLDVSVPSSQYKVIQEAVLDPGTRTPNLTVRYGVMVLGAFLIMIFGLVLMQFVKPLNMGKWHTSRN